VSRDVRCPRFRWLLSSSGGLDGEAINLEGIMVRANLMWGLMFGCVVIGVSGYVVTVKATPASGFTSTTIAMGRFGEIDVLNHTFFPASAPWNQHPGKNLWLSSQKTKGPSDLYVQNNVWAPGGSSGWHTHPGHSLITVIAGTVTAYEGGDPSCAPHTYEVGEGFVDPGGDHVHLLRNEGAVDARTVTVQLIPAGATRRIDAAASPYCGF
jgi:quercetin dioxygenase-like cupin family protein